MAVPPSVKGFVAGVSVEDVSGRGAKTKRFKNPDGSTTLSLSQRPVFYQDSRGAWQPVDTSVVADPSTPGGLMSKANAWTAHFAPLPVGVRIDSPEGPLAFSPVGAAPVAPTVTAADTVTYVNAWPGADLRYQVLGDEVKETIVLNRRPTAATFAFTTAGLGFNTVGGGALAPKRAKSQWTLTSPVILDKQGTPLPDAPVTLNPVGAAASAGLAVGVSPSWLAAQPDTAFPILVDPSAVYGSGNMTAYKSDGTTCTACGVRVGNPAQNNGTFYWRSVGYFDYTALFGQHISNATVTVSSLAGGTANGYPFGVWLPTAYSYAGAVGAGQEVAGTVDTQGNLSSAGLTGLFDYWVHNRIAGGSLGFTGNETAGLYTFKQFNNFTLSLTSYSTAPSAPQNPYASATTDGILHAAWSAPVDDGGAAVTYKINLYHQGGGAPANWLYCSGLSVTWSGLAEDTSWYFGITATNSAGSSAEVYTNTVTVDHAPGTPTSLLSYPGNGAAFVTWAAPADPGGSPITSYLVAAVDETDPAHPAVWGSPVCCSGYPITGLTNGHAYAIVVYAQDHDGSSPVPAISAANAYVTPSTNPPPYPVQQVYYASAADGGAFLTWRPPLATNGGAAWTSYAVSVWDTSNNATVYVGQYLNIAATATSFYYPGLTNGHPYLFAISAGNAAGYATVFTDTVTPSTTPPPNAATGATAQPGDGYAVLQWTQPNNTGATAATSYIIWRYDDTNPVSPNYLDYQVSQSAITNFTWSGLSNGTKYLFYVWAANNNGFAAPDVTDHGTPVIPQNTLGNLLSPTNVQATPADTTAVVTWTTPTLGFLATYTIKAYNAQNGNLAVTTDAANGTGPCTTGDPTYHPPAVTVNPPSGTACGVVGTLINGTSYNFTVTANLLGLAIPCLLPCVSAHSPAVVPAGRPLPPTIANVTNATTAGGAATVTWNPAANNGSPVTDYTLTATPAAGDTVYATKQQTTYNVPVPPPANYTANIAGLLNGSVYTITMTATNAIGTSDDSNTSAFTPTGVPFRPTNVVATLSGMYAATVTWADPTAQNGVPGDNGSAIDYYTVTASSGLPSQRIPVGTTTATFNNLMAGTTYTFTVTAHNANGDGGATASNTVTPQVAATRPGPPTNVGVTNGSGNTANITWGPAAPNGSPLTAYTVAMEPLCSSCTGTSPGPNANSTTVSGLTPGTEYYFAVYATNAVDVGPATIAASNPTNGVVNVAVGPGEFQVPEYSEAGLTVTANGLTPNTAYSIQYDSADGSQDVIAPSILTDSSGSFSTAVVIPYTGDPGGALVHVLTTGTGTYALTAGGGDCAGLAPLTVNDLGGIASPVNASTWNISQGSPSFPAAPTGRFPAMTVPIRDGWQSPTEPDDGFGIEHVSSRHTWTKQDIDETAEALAQPDSIVPNGTDGNSWFYRKTINGRLRQVLVNLGKLDSKGIPQGVITSYAD